MAVSRAEQKIYHGFISKDMEKLLLEIIRKEKKKYIFISSYTRYGNSGSKLYSIYFSKEAGGSVPHLLKTFEDNEKFKQEIKGIELIKGVYRYADRIKPFGIESELRGLLLENFNSTNNPITLANIIYNKDEKESEICKIINNAFNEFYSIKRTIKTKDCTIKTKYSRYLGKRADKTKKIIKDLTDDDIKEKKIKFYRQKIINPVYIINNMIKKTKITSALIHGDLHQNNIVLNDSKEPRIIDFEWSDENDIYIDFSFLEISVRYWNSPLLKDYKHLMNYKSKNALEDIFLHENVDAYIDIFDGDENAKRMIIIVSEIRRQCKEYIKKYTKEKYDFKHHLLSQFLILYGLQSHTSEYNPLLVIPFLAKLGDKLIKSGYVNEV